MTCAHPRRAGSRPALGTRALVSLSLVLLTLAGCGADPQEAYCRSVETHREELSSTLAEGGTTAVLDALPIMRQLRDEAPDDIRGDWNSLIGALEDLEKTLEELRVDPATYDRASPPAGLSSGQRARIDAAAARVGSRSTAEASERIQQHARDVCQTPLTL